MALGKGTFRYHVWDPLQLLLQMATLQAMHYLTAGALLGLTAHAVSAPRDLSLLFDERVSTSAQNESEPQRRRREENTWIQPREQQGPLPERRHVNVERCIGVGEEPRFISMFLLALVVRYHLAGRKGNASRVRHSMRTKWSNGKTKCGKLSG